MIFTTQFKKDPEHKRMFITRGFRAPLELVWKAWTEPSILDQWWAPKPWKAQTKSMDFRVGGCWLYVMAGPDGSQHWSRADYKSIQPLKFFEGYDTFCDEHGIVNPALPGMHWKVHFMARGSRTEVAVEALFDSRADLEKIAEMGFEAGFTAAHGNLDELLENK